MVPVYKEIANTFQAFLNCCERKNLEWKMKHRIRLEALIKDHLPSGAGFDNGTRLDFKASSPNKLVFLTAFHHHNESGYIGWSEHTITVVPDFVSDIDVKVSGRNVNDVKEYIAETFIYCLTKEIDELSEDSWYKLFWTEMDKIKRFGADAFRKGYIPESCTYEEGSPEREQWLIGYNEAKLHNSKVREY